MTAAAAQVPRGTSAAWLRGGVAVAAAGIVLDIAALGSGTLLVVVAAVLAVVCVAVPASAASLLLIVVAGAAVAVGGGAVGVGVLVLVPLVHLLHLSAAHAALLPAGSRFHLGALRPALVRAAGVQLVTFLLVGMVAALPAAPDATAVVLGLVACAAIVAVLAVITTPHMPRGTAESSVGGPP